MTIEPQPQDPDILAIRRRRRQAGRCVNCSAPVPRAALCTNCRATLRWCPNCAGLRPYSGPQQANGESSRVCAPCRPRTETPRHEYLAKRLAPMIERLPQMIKLSRRGLQQIEIARLLGVNYYTLNHQIQRARALGLWPTSIKVRQTVAGAILACLRKHGSASRSEINDHLIAAGFSAKSANTILGRLRQAGRIQTVGRGHKTRYTLTKKG